MSPKPFVYFPPQSVLNLLSYPEVLSTKQLPLRATLDRKLQRIALLTTIRMLIVSAIGNSLIRNGG